MKNRLKIIRATASLSAWALLALAPSAGALPSGQPMVRIDEVLADPPAELAGDANNDGVRDPFADEFVELFNAGTDTISLAGWSLSDDDTAPARRFVFPADARIPPGGRTVLFGGGAPTGFSGPVFTDDGRIGDGLGNSGDRVLLLDAGGDTADAVAGTAWDDDQSLVRFLGEFVPHATVPGRGTRFSPGQARVVADSLDLSPADTTVSIGATWTARARTYWSDGTTDSPPPDSIEWTGAELATVDRQGLILALGPGEAQIAGRYRTVASRPVHLHILPAPSPRDSAAVAATAPLPSAGDTASAADPVPAPDPLPATTPPDQANAAGPQLDSAAVAATAPLPSAGDTASAADPVPVPDPPPAAIPADQANAVVPPLDSSATALPSTTPVEPMLSDTPTSSAPALIRIDEILAGPPPGLQGDANNDGVRDPFADEFVELFNAGTDTISLAGWSLSDDDTAPARRFVFPADARIPPAGRVVLFGGGAPTGFSVPVFTDDGRIGDGLTNSGDTVLLLDAGGDTVDSVAGSDWPPDRSVVRWPEGQGEFAAHDAPPGSGELFSPNRPRALLEEAPAPEEVPAQNLPPEFRSTPPATAWSGVLYHYQVEFRDPDDDSLSLALEQAPPWLGLEGRVLRGVPPDGPSAGGPVRLRLGDGHGEVFQEFAIAIAPRPALLLTEILADPPADLAGDANGDGRADRDEDEFIEILNQGPPLDLGGWRLSDDDASPEHQFRFPPGTVLGTGEYLVLFGGGVPRDLPGLVFADDGRIGDGLANSNDRILLLAGDSPDTLIDFTYTSKPDLDQSLACQAGGDCVPHGQLPGRGLFSPGRQRLLYTHFSIDPLKTIQGRADTLVVRGYYPGGSELLPPSQVNWHVEDRRILQVDRAGVARGLRPGATAVNAWTPQLFLASGAVEVQALPPPPPPPNQPPRFLSAPDTLAYAGGLYHYLLQAEDPERASLVYALLQAPDWLRLDPDTHLLSGQVPPQAGGSARVAVEVDDGRGGLGAQQYTLHLLPPPQLRISEVLADPPAGPAGDANGDGQRQTYADEFIELWNADPQPVDLSALVLTDSAVELFRFPIGTVLLPGAYAVVFGGSAPPRPLFFSAGGRLGHGLGNRQGQLFLIDPSGPDTLARVGYALDRDPDQSLWWAPGSNAPLLHNQWPGRDLFSPGRARPFLQALSLEPPLLRLVRGERAQLKIMGRFSDGCQQELRLPARWHSSASAIAALGGPGVVVARDTGQTRIWAQLDTFPAAICQVQVRPPLAERLDFSPAWEQFSASPGHLVSFAVRSRQGETFTCSWSVDGQLLQTRASHLVHPAPALHPDTIQVEVRAQRETHVHRWLLRPSAPLSRLADTLIQVDPIRPLNHPNPFNSSTQIRFFLPGSGPAVSVRIYDLAGQLVRHMEVPPAAAGWQSLEWNGQDSQDRPAASGVYFYTIQRDLDRQMGKLLLLR